MSLELNLNFSSPDRVSVHLLDSERQLDEADPQPFAGPLDETAQQDLHWYLEVYPTAYTTDVDDARAAAIVGRLEEWGDALLQAVFTGAKACGLMDRFREAPNPGRLVTISSNHPAVLAQPWELLRDPLTRNFLFLEDPRVSVRRRLADAIKPHDIRAKDRLHLLFVISRPKDADFLDPRADALAVMDAIDAHAPGRISVEFLRPATLSALVGRLGDATRTPVDILHFDGHGAFDVEGRVGEAHQGYLLFETAHGNSHLVSAAALGDILRRKRVALVVLSACESAVVGGDDPMGGVAAGLTGAGLPSVLAMTHSVLVSTTKALFGALYRHLAEGMSIGLALDSARQDLHDHSGRVERQRGGERVTLHLRDWFLPALYQGGDCGALLTKAEIAPPPPQAWSNLPALPEAGFIGRTRELWQIEHRLAAGVRRLVVHGFGGQGKTFLAQEAGRWLHRTGLFQRVCFVSYANFQGLDPVDLAVSTMATVLNESLIDADAATRALAATPTLLILDNLESLDREPLDKILDAAVAWSDAGASRVLITTRSPDPRRADYPVALCTLARGRPLDGLAANDALAWFDTLMRLGEKPTRRPPDREDLLRLFALVKFHPLSIRLLAAQLKHRGAAELGTRLEELLHTESDELRASLALSLDRLDPNLRHLLPSLGVFQGGAFENSVLNVTELPPEQWAVSNNR
ncbi:MAG: CHAT domain-containing protein [Alphaproteobacteria bacterium]|nr:CHAT domain-containing protein [Alphaproteobacteria bacterium]